MITLGLTGNTEVTWIFFFFFVLFSLWLFLLHDFSLSFSLPTSQTWKLQRCGPLLSLRPTSWSEHTVSRGKIRPFSLRNAVITFLKWNVTKLIYSAELTACMNLTLSFFLLSCHLVVHLLPSLLLHNRFGFCFLLYKTHTVNSNNTYLSFILVHTGAADIVTIHQLTKLSWVFPSTCGPICKWRRSRTT